MKKKQKEPTPIQTRLTYPCPHCGAIITSYSVLASVPIIVSNTPSCPTCGKEVRVWVSTACVPVEEFERVWETGIKDGALVYRWKGND